MVESQDEDTKQQYMAALMQAIMRVLNCPPFDAITLPSGITIVNCLIREGEIVESDRGDYFYCEAPMQWSAYALIQDAGN